jgi:uncharacterized protein
MQDLLRNIQRLVIPITFKCNFDCQYCYVYKDKRAEFDKNTLKKIYKIFLKNNVNEERAIYFFGGEPLLRYDLLEWSFYEIEKLRKKYNKKLFLALTTNGVLLDENKLDFLVNNFDLVGVSIDDLKSDYSYRKVEQIKAKLPLLLKYKDKILIKMTIMPEIADSFFSTYEYLIRLGFKNINISPALGFYWEDEQVNSFLRNLEKVLKKGKILKKYGFDIHLKMVEDVKYIINSKKEHCPILREELAIGPSGNIYPCQFFVALPKQLREQFVLANINKPDVDRELMKKVEDFKICKNNLIGEEIPKCKDCQIDRTCKKVCYGFNIKEDRFDARILHNAWQLENAFMDLVKKHYL